jgi:hypothetical protein
MDLVLAYSTNRSYIELMLLGVMSLAVIVGSLIKNGYQLGKEPKIYLLEKFEGLKEILKNLFERFGEYVKRNFFVVFFTVYFTFVVLYMFLLYLAVVAGSLIIYILISVASIPFVWLLTHRSLANIARLKSAIVLLTGFYFDFLAS